jgi:hypothetical protein
MKIKDLPKGGGRFKTTTGAGNFSKKLSSATRYGELKNLGDNKEAMIKAIKKHERAIRVGSFNRKRQLSAWSQIKKEEGAKLTKDDRKEIKAILKHLGEGQKKKEEIENKVKIDKQLAKDDSFSEDRKQEIREQIRRFSRTKGGGESSLQFSSGPENDDKMSASGKLLQRRFMTKEVKLKDRMPRQRVEWEKERKKRFEVSSLGKNDNNNEKGSDNKGDDKKSTYQSFQNL